MWVESSRSVCSQLQASFRYPLRCSLCCCSLRERVSEMDVISCASQHFKMRSTLFINWSCWHFQAVVLLSWDSREVWAFPWILQHLFYVIDSLSCNGSYIIFVSGMLRPCQLVIALTYCSNNSRVRWMKQHSVITVWRSILPRQLCNLFLLVSVWYMRWFLIYFASWHWAILG